MFIDSIEALEAVYDKPVPPPAKATELPCLIAPYVKLIEASPFFVLATAGPEGLDCSARGDPPGFVRVSDSSTLMFPDRPGNNKIDSLRNIVRDPRASMMFLIPGTGTILRINGKARITIDEALRRSFAINGAIPKSVVVVAVEVAYLQCARALLRSRMWESAAHIDPSSVPSMGDILAFLADGVDGKAFDEAAPARMRNTLW